MTVIHSAPIIYIYFIDEKKVSIENNCSYLVKYLLIACNDYGRIHFGMNG